MLNKRFKAGSQKSSNPRLVEEIVKDYLANSNEPFATAYRQQQARQQEAKRLHMAGAKAIGWQKNTELCMDVTTLLHEDRAMQPGKEYLGVLRKDVESDEYRYDEHMTFVEVERQKGEKRNLQLYKGLCVNVNQQNDGRKYLSFNRPRFTEDFTFKHFCLMAAEELLTVAGLLEE